MGAHPPPRPSAPGRTDNTGPRPAARAEATRQALSANGVTGDRFARIEGVAEREPYVPADIYDPRNRRMSITLAWSADASATTPAAATSP